MKKQFIALGIFLLLVISMGCVLQDPRTNPAYSVFPEILLDYDKDAGETGIWVKSALSDFKYDSIVIEIKDEDNKKLIIQENNTYCTYTFTELLKFEVEITVNSDEKVFSIHQSIDIEFIEGELAITIINVDKESEDLIYEDDLPYKKVLDED